VINRIRRMVPSVSVSAGNRPELLTMNPSGG
jgi:hypothetical protein